MNKQELVLRASKIINDLLDAPWGCGCCGDDTSKEENAAKEWLKEFPLNEVGHE